MLVLEKKKGVKSVCCHLKKTEKEEEIEVVESNQDKAEIRELSNKWQKSAKSKISSMKM